MKTADLSHASGFAFLVPVFGLTMGVVFFQEQLSVVTMVGIVLTLLGIYQIAKGVQPRNEAVFVVENL